MFANANRFNQDLSCWDMNRFAITTAWCPSPAYCGNGNCPATPAPTLVKSSSPSTSSAPTLENSSSPSMSILPTVAPSYAPTTLPPTVSPTVVPTSPPSLDLCKITDVLGQTIFVSGAGACWRVQLGEGGTIENDSSDPGCSDISTWASSYGDFSLFNGIEMSQQTATFIAGTNGYSGTIRFREDPAVTMPGLTVLSFDGGSGVFEVEITLSTCSADAICPVMKIEV